MNGEITIRSLKPRSGIRTRIAAVLCLILVSLCLNACSHIRLIHDIQPAANLQWPQKPYQAKIEWIKSIAYSEDVGISKKLWKKMLDFFIGNDDRNIVRPYGVHFDANERLFIADPGAGLVHIMDMKEERYSVVGSDSGSPLRTPIGLTEDEQGHLYITDSTTGKVYVYDLSGRSLKPFLARTLERPTGIVYNKINKLIYIVETGGHQVIAVDLGGTERLRFGSLGDISGRFNHPTDITVDTKGQVYVTDPLNYQIRVFSPDGQPVSQFGSAGDAPGNLNKPKGVAVDSEGHIYVCDALLDTVQVFDDTGQLLIFFGDTGSGDGEFWMPSGIFIDKNDYIFVADSYNRRIQVFRYISKKRAEDDNYDEPDTTRPFKR